MPLLYPEAKPWAPGFLATPLRLARLPLMSALMLLLVLPAHHAVVAKFSRAALKCECVEQMSTGIQHRKEAGVLRDRATRLHGYMEAN